MARRVQLRRGTSAQHDSFTGALAEVTVDTTTGMLRLHNGTTLGGSIINSSFHVEWYGASIYASDAVNGTALNTAIAACGAAGGGRVQFSFGTYEYDTTLTLFRGVHLVACGKVATTLLYTGNGVGISASWAGDINTRWNGSITGLKLTTTTDSPSVGPGTHGLRIEELVGFVLDNVEIRGFDVAGVELVTSTGRPVISIHIINGSLIHENTRGLIHTGVNNHCNHVSVRDSAIRANIEWNVYNGQIVRAWGFHNALLENGGTGGGAHGSMFLQAVYGLSIGGGTYFEQLSGTSATCLELSNTIDSLGVSITGTHVQGPASGTAMLCGTSANVRGFHAAGNFFSGFDIAIDANGIIGGQIGPNSYNSVTTPVAVSAYTTGLMIVEDTGLRLVRMPIAHFDGITAPGTLAGYAQTYVDTATGDLTTKFGDGFVRVIGVDS